MLGANEKQLLFTLCCDESLAQSVPYIRQRAADMLQIVDSVSYNVYRAASVICNSTDSYCNFLLASAYTAQVNILVCHLLEFSYSCYILLESPFSFLSSILFYEVWNCLFSICKEIAFSTMTE